MIEGFLERFRIIKQIIIEWVARRNRLKSNISGVTIVIVNLMMRIH